MKNNPEHIDPLDLELTDANGLGLMPEMELPAGYFENFASNLMEVIQLEEFLATLPKQNPYNLPAAYFEDFRQELNQTMEAEVILSALPKGMPYKIPTAYFDQLIVDLRRELGFSAGASKGFSVTRGLVRISAIAATILLFVGLAFQGLMIGGNEAGTEYQLNQLSYTEIDNYLTEHQAEISNLVYDPAQLSEETLDKIENEVFDHALDGLSEADLLTYTL